MQIKRCHQPKPQSRPTLTEDSSEIGKSLPDIDTIRNRVGELKNRLGALQVSQMPSHEEASIDLVHEMTRLSL